MVFVGIREIARPPVLKLHNIDAHEDTEFVVISNKNGLGSVHNNPIKPNGSLQRC